MITFSEIGHEYKSVVPDGRTWISVSTLVGALCEMFDPVAMSVKSSRNTKSKWYGIPPEKIQEVWKRIGEDACTKGSLYHLKREQGLYELPNCVQPIVQGDSKIAPDQRLQVNSIYPEHMVYLDSIGICGQSDKVETTDTHIHISDYKTNREIKRQGYTNWEGVSKKMLKPVSHMDDCEYNKYSLQLSMYMYIILRHNPMLQPGKLTIEHVKFRENGTDCYGYPTYETNSRGEPIVREIEIIEVPYRKAEVQNIINWLKIPENRIKVINSKH